METRLTHLTFVVFEHSLCHKVGKKRLSESINIKITLKVAMIYI